MEVVENIQMVIQPRNLNVTLFPHQLASIFQMETFEREKKVERDYFIKESNIGVNADPTGFGKCFELDTEILLYNGSIKKVQDINVGDLLMGDDSTPRNVLSLAKGRENMYTIHQKSGGDDYTVNESHILCLKMTQPKRIKEQLNRIDVFYFCSDKIRFKSKSFLFSSYSNYKTGAYQEATEFYDNLNIDPRVDIEVRQYLKLPTYIQRDLKGYRVCVEFQEKEVDLDPYFIGLWLGSSSKTITDQKVIDYLYQTFNDYDKIVNSLKKYNIFSNKHIPSCYLINSRRNRLKLLAGLLDSAGFYKNGVYEIAQKKEILSKNIIFLARSLGFLAKDLAKEDRITISGENITDIPVLINRKEDSTHPDDNQLCTDINIISKGEGDYYGFTLDGNHRFLLQDFTVTHNTLSMIGLILRDKMEWDVETPYVFEIFSSEAGGRIKKRVIQRYDKFSATLVLVSQSIIGQWEQELKHTPLRVGTVSSRKHIDNVDPEECDVVLVTPSMYNSLIISHKGYAWKRFIFEEPGHLRVSGMKEVHAGFYWFVTATPNSITVNHRNCRNSFMREIVGNSWWDFETQFDGMIFRNDPAFVTSSFNMPPTSYEYHECYNPVLNSIRGFVTDSIKNMIEAGNIEGAITALGGGKTGNIIDLVKQKKLEELEEIEAKIRIYTIRNDEDRLNEWTERKTRINSQIQELDGKLREMLQGSCHICLEPLTEPVMEPGCQNLFCGQCLLTWLTSHSSCPLCRTTVDTKELIYIETNEETNEETKEETRTMTKLEKIVDIINNNKHGKFIIFSAFDNTFTPICKALVENNISFTQIKGTIGSRQKSLNEFKNGETTVIFLNTNFNGAGINLQEATDIILYHEMTTNTQTQILGRAIRIGRTKSLKVHYLQVKV